MATIGLSRPYVAIYSAAGTTITHSAGRMLGKATELDVSLNDGSKNVFYANNGPAESDDRFSGGTLTITTDDLRPASLIMALGLVREAISGVSGVSNPDAAWMVYNDNQAIPYLSFGGVVMKQVDNVTKYLGIIYDKIKFANPNKSIKTMGEQIEWQAPQLVAQIYRSDAADHKWNRETNYFDTEAEADAAVRDYLGITEASITPSLSALTVGSLTLDPTFASNKLAYTTTTTNAGDAITATASNAGDEIAITVNGSPLANGGVPVWATGSNLVKITVTNSGGAQYLYTVEVTKSAGA